MQTGWEPYIQLKEIFFYLIILSIETALCFFSIDKNWIWKLDLLNHYFENVIMNKTYVINGIWTKYLNTVRN